MIMWRSILLLFLLIFLPTYFADQNCTGFSCIKNDDEIVLTAPPDAGRSKRVKREAVEFCEGFSCLKTNDEIIVTPPVGKSGKSKRAAPWVDVRWFWKNATVPIILAPDLAPEKVPPMKYSMKAIQDVTCVVFIEVKNTSDKYPNAILAKNSDSGCNSVVGTVYFKPGKQNLNLDTCGKSNFVAAHELLHALGIFHEHTRPDRDAYVRVFKDAMTNPNAMDKGSDTKVEILTPYDLSSLMHYSGQLFAKNFKKQLTMEPMNPLLKLNDPYKENLGPYVRGTSNVLSFRDRMTLNRVYMCSAKCAKPIKKCMYNGYVDKSCQCKCIPGMSGPTCEQFTAKSTPASCGKMIDVKDGPSMFLTTEDYPNSWGKLGTDCFYFLRVLDPAKRIRYRVVDYECTDSHMTIDMYGPEVDLRPISCKKDIKSCFMNRWFVSQHNYTSIRYKTGSSKVDKTRGAKIEFETACKSGDKWTSCRKTNLVCHECTDGSESNSTYCSDQMVNRTSITACPADTKFCKVSFLNSSDAFPAVTRTCSADCKNQCLNNTECTYCCNSPLCNGDDKAKTMTNLIAALTKKKKVPTATLR